MLSRIKLQNREKGVVEVPMITRHIGPGAQRKIKGSATSTQFQQTIKLAA